MRNHQLDHWQTPKAPRDNLTADRPNFSRLERPQIKRSNRSERASRNWIQFGVVCYNPMSIYCCEMCRRNRSADVTRQFIDYVRIHSDWSLFRGEKIWIWKFNFDNSIRPGLSLWSNQIKGLKFNFFDQIIKKKTLKDLPVISFCFHPFKRKWGKGLF